MDYHGTLEAYAEAKARLFQFNSLKVAVINLDDAHADLMIKSAQNNPAQPKILTYSLTQNTADYYITDLSYSLAGATFNLVSQQGSFAVESPLLGHFNVENLIAALIAAEQAGFDLQALVNFVPKLIVRQAECKLFVMMSDYL